MKNALRLLVGELAFGGVLLLALSGSSDAGVFGKEDTPGEHFEKAMNEIAKQCASRKLAPNEVCGEVAKLKPADPLATEEGRFAHSIKIPNPVPEDSGYRPGMTPQEYFDHLCKTEAGEFIYKTVENVEGLVQLRPRDNPTDYQLEHLYALEDPYGYSVGVRDHPEEYFVQPTIGKYQFLEISLIPRTGSSAAYRRYYRDEKAHLNRDYQTAINGRFVRVPYIVAEENVSSRKGRYGYTWRGVSRPHDRELGIAGGEIIVLDLQTSKVLAVRRSYVRSGDIQNKTSVWWLTAQKCSKESLKTDAQFINHVLKPAQLSQERTNDSK